MRAAFLALMLITSTAQAEPTLDSSQWRQLHEAVCAGSVSRNAAGIWACDKARDYPTYPNCPISFEQQRQLVHFGAFTKDAHQAIAIYHAGCEPHANNFGGLALFGMEGGRFSLIRYFPGWVMTGCVVVQGTSRDTAYCTASSMGQGQLDESFGPLSMDSQGQMGMEGWLAAGNADGFYGQMLAPCSDRSFQPHHIIGVHRGKGSSVIVEAAYVDPLVVDQACLRKKTRTTPSVSQDADPMDAPEGHVFLDDARLLKARIYFHPPSAKPIIKLTQEPAAAD